MPPRPTSQIRDALSEMIITGRFRDGERLDEQSLADHFGVSRTPLREALQALAASGLVRQEHRRGAFVHYPALEDVIEMFQVMAEVEAICGRYAVSQARPEDLAAIEGHLRACEAAAGASDIAGYYRANQAFHSAIYNASGNRFLAAEAERLSARLSPSRRMQLEAHGRIAQSLAEHRIIFTALAARDEAATLAALRAHIEIQGTRFNDLLSGYRRIASRPRAQLRG